jgi:hypothetical protein
MFKRGIQLLILAILVSANLQLEADESACEIYGPQWCCENIYCPIAQDLCTMNNGTMTHCRWDGTWCDAAPCVYS